uniref:Uncharacterized protein n=1 Tax=Xenopus tropicalis TaxID=8364 RepID=A0A803JXT4_XENTR
MNDTEERRDWLADLVYQELELIKEYGSIQELENQRKEALRVCAPSFWGFQQAQPCLGTVGPKDFHLPPSTVSAGVGEEQEASQTTLFWSPREIPVCEEFSGCVTPVLAEPESGCFHFKGLAEAEASPSEIPNCVEPGAAQFEKSSKEGRDEDSPLPELLLAGEEQDQEESIAQHSPMSIRAVSSGNGVRGTPKAQRVTRAVVPETPSGRQQGQRITPQRNKTLGDGGNIFQPGVQGLAIVFVCWGGIKAIWTITRLCKFGLMNWWVGGLFFGLLPMDRGMDSAGRRVYGWVCDFRIC